MACVVESLVCSLASWMQALFVRSDIIYAIHGLERRWCQHYLWAPAGFEWCQQNTEVQLVVCLTLASNRPTMCHSDPMWHHRRPIIISWINIRQGRQDFIRLAALLIENFVHPMNTIHLMRVYTSRMWITQIWSSRVDFSFFFLVCIIVYTYKE